MPTMRLVSTNIKLLINPDVGQKLQCCNTLANIDNISFHHIILLIVVCYHIIIRNLISGSVVYSLHSSIESTSFCSVYADKILVLFICERDKSSPRRNRDAIKMMNGDDGPSG